MNLIDIFYKEDDVIEKLSNVLGEIIKDDLVIICIGTDKVIFDALGPILGTYLERKQLKNIHIYGTLEKPIHARNIDKEVSRIIKKYPKNKILAIDACLGRVNNIGKITVNKGPIYPGRGVKNNLAPIGDYSIKAVTSNTYLDTVRLNLIVEIATVICESIAKSYNQKDKK